MMNTSITPSHTHSQAPQLVPLLSSSRPQLVRPNLNFRTCSPSGPHLSSLHLSRASGEQRGFLLGALFARTESKSFHLCTFASGGNPSGLERPHSQRTYSAPP